MLSIPVFQPRDLGDGLLLRQATVQDVPALIQFNGEVHAEEGPFDPAIAAISRESLEGRHPTLRPDHHLIVIDTQRDDRIVSSIQYVPQVWNYGPIPFPIGRIEAVGTHPEYRRKGLVRIQFDVAHSWAEEMEHLATFVTGIPWYYTQFGYEEALVFRIFRVCHLHQIPQLLPDTPEPFNVRPATPDDIPFLHQLDSKSHERYLISTEYSETDWAFDMTGRAPESLVASNVAVLTQANGERIGYFQYGASLNNGALALLYYEILPGISWLAAGGSLLRFLAGVGREMSEATGKPFNRLIVLGEAHPLFTAYPERVTLSRNKGWNAYMRVPHLDRFLSHIAPVLEERLARSVAVGYTGTIALNLYRSGWEMVIEQGKIKAINPWRAPTTESGTWAYPDLVFLRRLFGWQSQEQVEENYPGCHASGPEARVLANILFPRLPSSVRSIS